jgi:hypothetical protein
VIERLRTGRIAHGIQATQHGLFVRTQTPHKLRIVQGGLAVCRTHLLQRVQTTGDHLLAVRRHLLPFRQQRSLHILPLIRRHALPRRSAIFQRTTFCGRQIIVLLQILANLLLPLRRQAAEAFVILQKVILLLRRHLPEALHPWSGQFSFALSICTRAFIRWRVTSLPLRAIGIRWWTIIIAVGMLAALIRAGTAAAIRVIRISALIAATISALIGIRVRAGSLWMVLRMTLRMRRPRRLHALLPELPGRVHAPRAVRPLRRRRLRAH